ncbi:uncharacterized protein LOC127857456 [Dreissena polymorpha]|uniref:uncharacterized protein LOC127857456 n=1 Tax=Dreissena polymorpha TaxID=45954 RepID=UPI0022648A55|nr:uncharacterized protein LOC127857456 [Dreissena polymorpha]
MALHQVTNSEVRHWTKGCLAIRLLKDGLTSYVKSEIEHQYAVVVKTIKTRSKISAFSCSSCNIQNLLPYHACSERETQSCFQKPSNMCNCAKKHGKRKCPQGGACSLMYDYTIKEHFHSSPTFQNSDLRKWSTNNWEYAKCFISGSGKFGVTDVFDTDSAGLLSICLNNHSIRSQFEVSILEQAIQVRNDIFHSGSHQLQNDVVQGYIDMFLAVLRQPPLLCNHEAKDAVMKLASVPILQINNLTSYCIIQ